MFTSSKERRLWIWAAAVLAAIALTLIVGRSAAEELRERNLLKIVVGLSVILAGLGGILIPWLKKRPGPLEVGAVLGVTLAYWWSWIRIGTPEERTHLIEYAILAVFVHRALIERRKNGRGFARPHYLAFGSVALLGLIDETLQIVIPGRFFDIVDVGFNTLAAFLAVGGRLVIAWSRRRRARG